MNEKIADLKGLCREWTKEHTQVLAEKILNTYSDVVKAVEVDAGLTDNDTKEFYEALANHALSMSQSETQRDVKAVLEFIHDWSLTLSDVEGGKYPAFDYDGLVNCFFWL